MNPIDIELENIFCYKKTYFDFRNIDFALFQGDNGVGKSFFFDSIFLIMYGKTARKKYKKIIRDIPKKQSYAIGTYRFEIEGIVYKIVRAFGRGKKLELYINDIKSKLRKPTLIQEEINNIIGADYDTALNVCYFSQGDVGKVLSEDSTKRIEIISKLLNLFPIDKARENTKKELNVINRKVEYNKGQIEGLNNMISGFNLEKVQRKVKMLQDSINALNEKLEQCSYDLVSSKEKRELLNKRKNLLEKYEYKKENRIDERNKYISELKILKNKIKVHNDEILKLKEYKIDYDRYNFIQDTNSEIEKRINLKQNYISSKTSNIINARKTLIGLYDVKELKGTECPTCKNILTESNLIVINEIIEKQEAIINKESILVEKRKEEIVELNSEINNNLKEMERIKKSFNMYKILKGKLGETKKNKIIFINKKKEYLSYKEKSLIDLKEIKIEIGKLNKDIQYYDKYSIDEIFVLEKRFNFLNNKINELEGNISAFKFKISQYNKIKNKIKLLSSGIIKYEDNYKIMQWWVDNYPIIKLDMINEVIPFIESESNKNLNKILPGYTIKFILDTSKSVNKLDIVIKDYINQVERIYEGWSGGQRDKMSLSIYLALNKLASKRAGKSINFLLLDEKFASIDKKSRPFVFEMLKDEYKDRKIMAISHLENIGNEFNQLITVVNKDGISDLKIKNNNFNSRIAA